MNENSNMTALQRYRTGFNLLMDEAWGELSPETQLYLDEELRRLEL